MYYAIDFDTRSVEFQTTDGEAAAGYLLDNNLQDAVTIVEDEDSLALELSVNEMCDLYMNIVGEPAKFTNESTAAENVMAVLRSNTFPEYSDRLARRLLKEAQKRCSDASRTSNTTSKPKRSKAVSVAPAPSSADLSGVVFNATSKAPRSGSAYEVFTACIDENLGSATAEELVQAFVDAGAGNEAKAKRRIRKAIAAGYIEEGL